ncbi:hypothetical protein [Priestia megaterium]|uniref:hypothetical protein n=1 Tax=Priestia megaterium TaxID=1404 RepID=UPI002220A647|nr:hypothetical protein [Priestia megaterium]UYV54500.1 hypothetical protein OHU65_07935 [Priestia megaterium]
MGITAKSLLLFILWGGLSALIFQLVSPSSLLVQCILIFFIGSMGAYLGNYLRSTRKK